MSHRSVTTKRAHSGDTGSPVPQAFPVSVTAVTTVTTYIITYTRTRTHARTRTHGGEFGGRDSGPSGDSGDSQTRVLSRGGAIGGVSDPDIFRFSVFPDSTFARVPS